MSREHPTVIQPQHSGARVLVRVQPEESWLSLPRPKLARQLLEALNIGEECALVVRGGELLQKPLEPGGSELQHRLQIHQRLISVHQGGKTLAGAQFV